MVSQKYNRTIEELREHAVMFWPKELSKKEASLSLVPKLIETQDQFISLLKIEIDSIEHFFSIIDYAKLKGNLFLKGPLRNNL